MTAIVKHVLFVEQSQDDVVKANQALGEPSRRSSRSARAASDSGSEGGERSMLTFNSMLDPEGEATVSELLQPMASSLQALVDTNDELRRQSGMV